MGRGYIYCITNDKNADISFGESDYYDRLDALRVDYVIDLNRKESEAVLKTMENMLHNLGAVTVRNAGGPFAFSFTFQDAEKVKRGYFKPRLEELKKKASELTLEAMVRSAPSIDWLIDNEFGDLIVLKEQDPASCCLYESDVSLDEFIRRLESGVTYYVYEKVIFMH